jgi:predicted deacylase
MAGVVEPRTIVFSDSRLAGLEHPAFEARGARDGPHLALIAGVHGCEYSSIAAVIRFMNELETSELAGSITAVPVVSMQSFWQRSPFVVPEDGKNLNRCFPGTYDGTYTDALARSIFDELIAPADYLIDLHGGDLVEALEPFAIYDASPVEERARALAVAFGLPYVVREDPEGGLAGMTCSAAAGAGIPAVIAEAGGCGQLDPVAVDLLVEGTR